MQSESDKITNPSNQSGSFVEDEADVPADDDMEVVTISNDFKRTIQKKEKWSEKKVLKMSLIESPFATPDITPTNEPANPAANQVTNQMKIGLIKMNF